MKHILTFAALALILPGLQSCKTTEANYRQAYEKAIARDDDDMPLDSTVYGTQRNAATRVIETPDGPVEVRAKLVRITEGGGGIPEKLHRFNVVAGQFKQRFNAISMRDRLADAGYPGAFVVETAEPYYYIVVASCSDAAEAAREAEQFKNAGVITMREPCPFILDATARRTTAK